MDTNELIEQAKRLMHGITPGPWEVYGLMSVRHNNGRGVATTGGYSSNVDFEAIHRENEANAAFIAAAPELVAGLLAEVARLTAALEWYADEDNYDGDGVPYTRGVSDVGLRARRALGRE